MMKSEWKEDIINESAQNLKVIKVIIKKSIPGFKQFLEQSIRVRLLLKTHP